MSNKKQANRTSGKAAPAGAAGRRKFLLAGLGGAAGLAGLGLAGYQAGWFTSAPTGAPAPAATPAYPNDMNAVAKSHLTPVKLPADLAGATKASDEIVRHYALELMSPSALIHLVRADGREARLADGTKVVDHLCERYFAEREVNGKRYVYVPREFEVHENSFLKTFLEAGVSPDQPIRAGSNRYTLKQFGESALALFRFDPQNPNRYEPTLYTQHLPWGLIAFSILQPPAESVWTNAYGEKIDLAAVFDRGLAEYESTCLLTRDALRQGQPEPEPFRQEIKKYSCFGLHSVYGFLSGLRHGYRSNNLDARLRELMDLVILRLKGDAEMIDQEYAAAASQPLPPQMLATLARFGLNQPQVAEALRLRAQIKMYGHAFEAINYARLHKLFAFTPEQERRLQAGEAAFYDVAVRMRALNLGGLRQWDAKIVSDIVIALGHAARAMKLLTPENPDALA